MSGHLTRGQLLPPTPRDVVSNSWILTNWLPLKTATHRIGFAHFCWRWDFRHFYYSCYVTNFRSEYLKCAASWKNITKSLGLLSLTRAGLTTL